jgi:hypothetical protein
LKYYLIKHSIIFIHQPCFIAVTALALKCIFSPKPVFRQSTQSYSLKFVSLFGHFRQYIKRTAELAIEFWAELYNYLSFWPCLRHIQNFCNLTLPHLLHFFVTVRMSESTIEARFYDVSVVKVELTIFVNFGCCKLTKSILLVRLITNSNFSSASSKYNCFWYYG